MASRVEHMSDDHTVRTSSLAARLSSVEMDIDDDEDVLFVTVDMTNEAAIPIGGLDIAVVTSDGKKVASQSGISSLGPGLTRNFTFEFPLETGTWTFEVSGSQNLSLGPYEADFTYEADQGRMLGNSIGASLFSGAFDQDLGMFGQINEREMIDPSKMVMTTYFGENAEGGSTKISIGDPSNDVESDSEDDDALRIPPWEKQNSEPTPSSAASSGDLLLQAAQVQASEPKNLNLLPR